MLITAKGFAVDNKCTEHEHILSVMLHYGQNYFRSIFKALQLENGKRPQMLVELWKEH